jgi:hypothetical protein
MKHGADNRQTCSLFVPTKQHFSLTNLGELANRLLIKEKVLSSVK